MRGSRHAALALFVVALHAALVAADVLPRYDALAFAGVAAVFAWLVRDAAPRVRTAACVLFFVIFGAGVFANQLSTGVEGRHALVGGIIPWSDAEGFLSNAWRALHGLPFSTNVTLTAMRPLYPMSLALTLAAVGMNVKLALGAYALAVAVAMGAVASELGARYGWRALAGVLVVFAFYERRYLFVFGTESIGVLAGLVAFWCMLHALPRGGATIARGPALGAAFLCFGLALAARPGPLFAVPLLLFWVWKRAEPALRARTTGIAAAMFAVALAFNAIVVGATAESGTPGGEFPPILYGALHGEDYTYLAEVHPDVANLPQKERIGATARLVGSEIAHRPWLALGFAQGAGAFLVGPHGLFSLGFYDPDDAYFEGKGSFGEKLGRFAREAGVYRIVNLVAMAALSAGFVFGVLRSFWRRRRVRGDLLSDAAQLTLAGAALSACVTPPWITESAQLQASVLAYTAILPFVLSPSPRPDPSPSARPSSLLLLAPALLAAWLVAAFALVATRPRDLPASSCAPDSPTRIVSHEPSTLVTVRGPDEDGYTLARLERNLRFVGKHNPDLADPIRAAATPGLGIEMVFDACAERAGVVLAPAADLARRPRGWVTLPLEPVAPGVRVWRLANR